MTPPDWPAGPGTDPERFWEERLIGWEEGRYHQATGRGLLERIADRASDSLRFRLEATGRLMAPHVVDRHVVDLGCGTGLLADAVLRAGAASYTGLDIAPSAIARARTRAEKHGLDRARFEVARIDALPDLRRDVVVSLGLTDWLTDPELEALFAWGGPASFLHAFSERRPGPSQWAHRAYCWLAYGWRTGGYVPRYMDGSWISEVATRHHPGPTRIWRHPRLSFGALLTSFPFDEQPTT